MIVFHEESTFPGVDFQVTHVLNCRGSKALNVAMDLTTAFGQATIETLEQMQAKVTERDARPGRVGGLGTG